MGSTHPTGMLSCDNILVHFKNWNVLDSTLFQNVIYKKHQRLNGEIFVNKYFLTVKQNTLMMTKKQVHFTSLMSSEKDQIVVASRK